MGCGFTPVHGTYGSHAETQGQVDQYFAQTFIDAIADETGQILYNQLVERINRTGYAQNGIYRLTISPIQEHKSDLDITENDNVTRTQMELKAVMTLKAVQSGSILFNRTIRSLTSFNVLSSEFATRVSEKAARTSALNDMAKQIETQLALYYSRSSD